MPGVTRVHGFGNYATGATVSGNNLGAYLIDLGGDIQAEDDGAGEAVEAAMMEIQPLMYSAPSAGNGHITVIVDNSQNDAASMQVRLRNLGTTVGPNDYDMSGATVTAATTVTAA